MLRVLVVSLNSLDGEGVFCGATPSAFQKEVWEVWRMIAAECGTGKNPCPR